MSDRPIKTKVLITVMTYPHPSRGYQELVCTAGINENNEWVRLYPIDYRYRPRNQQFRKYQWVEIDLLPRGDKNDRRKESRKPLLDSLQVLGEPLSTKNGWRERWEIIDRMSTYTVKQLREMHEAEQLRWGLCDRQGCWISKLSLLNRSGNRNGKICLTN